jgi:hypothetical protein
MSKPRVSQEVRDFWPEFSVVQTGSDCQALLRRYGRYYAMVTDVDGLGVPKTLDEPVGVGIYARETDDCVANSGMGGMSAVDAKVWLEAELARLTG